MTGRRSALPPMLRTKTIRRTAPERGRQRAGSGQVGRRWVVLGVPKRNRYMLTST
jgi:hypothetical protein